MPIFKGETIKAVEIHDRVLIEYVAEEFSVDEVFSDDDLHKWALENGYVKFHTGISSQIECACKEDA